MDPSPGFIQAYSDTLHAKYSEDPDGIREAVRVKLVTGKLANFEVIGGVNMTAVTSRHQDTPYTPATQTRRRANLVDYAASDLLDPLDDVKLLISPESEITQGLIRAWHRRVARSVMAAAIGSASAVDNAETVTATALPSAQKIANGTAGMTMAKIRQAGRILSNAGCPMADRHAWVSHYAIEDLLQDSTVTSADFSTLQALMHGTFPPGATFMGFKWHTISDADPDEGSSGTKTADSILSWASNIRECVFHHKSALGLAIAKDLTVEIDKRPDKMNARQVLVQTCLGAVRIDDFGVVQVSIDESV